MSGSGGGGGIFPGAGPSGGGLAGGEGAGVGSIPCEALAFETQLSSPKSEVIEGLKVKDVLDIELKQDGSVLTIQVLRGGKVAGGLTAPDIKRLRECILHGYIYKATVTAVASGQVKVRVKLAV